MNCKDCWKQEVRGKIIELRKEFANTPIKKRGTGWDWLNRVDELLK